MRLRARVDANQAALVQAARGMGASVQVLSQVGRGVPDLLVGFRGLNVLVEVKDGAAPPSARKLTQDESDWHDAWDGQVAVVASVSGMVDLLLAVARLARRLSALQAAGLDSPSPAPAAAPRARQAPSSTP